MCWQCIYENHRMILTIAGLSAFAIATLVILISKMFKPEPDSHADKAIGSVIVTLLFVFCICYIILSFSVLIEGFVKFIR